MKTEQRKSNIELLRIVLILMVIILHYMNAQMGGLFGNAQPGSLNYYLGHLIEALSIGAVNVFILITGYFSYRKTYIKVSKTVKLFSIMVLYGLVLSISVLLSQHALLETRNIVSVIEQSFSQWFVVIYCILYLLIPYINKLANALSKKQFTVILTISFIFFYCWPTFFTNVTVMDNGYGITNFITLYLIGFYIRKYDFHFKREFTLYFAFSIITFGFSIVSERAWNYNSPFVLISCIALFQLFKNLKIKHHPWINRLATYTFAVYIIDVNGFFNKVLYRTLFRSNQFWNSNLMILNLLVTVIGIYVICLLIEFVRRILLDRLLDKLMSKITYKISV